MRTPLRRASRGLRSAIGGRSLVQPALGACLVVALPGPGSRVGPPASMEAARVHTRLEASVPSADDTLRSPLAGIRLEFSGPVQAELSTAAILAGADSLPLALRADSARPELLTADPPPLPEGTHALVWETVSRDGHRVSGRFRFHVLPAAATSGPEAARETTAGSGDAPAGTTGREAGGEEAAAGGVPAAGGTRPPTGAPGDASGLPSPGAAVLRAAALLALLGFGGWLWFAPPQVARAGSAAALGAGAFLLPAADLWRWASVASGDARIGEVAGALLALPTARAGVVQLVLVLVGLSLFFGLRRPARVAALPVLAAALVDGASGHSAAVRPLLAVPLNGIHLLAAAIWLGGLLVLGSRSAAADPDAFRRAAGRVSGAALAAVIVLAATGAAQSLVFVGGIGEVFSTGYGRLVLGKWAGWAVLVGFGARHRLHLLPALEDRGEPAPLRRSVRVELAVMLAVLLIAALLGHLPPPAGSV